MNYQFGGLDDTHRNETRELSQYFVLHILICAFFTSPEPLKNLLISLPQHYVVYVDMNRFRGVLF